MAKRPPTRILRCPPVVPVIWPTLLPFVVPKPLLRVLHERRAELPASEDPAGRAARQPVFTRTDGQVVNRRQDVVVGAVEVRESPALREVDRRADARVLVREVLRAAERVRVRDHQAVSEASIDLELHAVVPRLAEVRALPRRAGPVERRELRPARVARSI